MGLISSHKRNYRPRKRKPPEVIQLERKLAREDKANDKFWEMAGRDEALIPIYIKKELGVDMPQAGPEKEA
ncbi:hypothetical protein ACFLTP_04025 [Chloroflexota bacterium]